MEMKASEERAHGVYRRRFNVRIKSDDSMFLFGERRRGTTHTMVSFPSQCPRCLGTRDLTSYTTNWKYNYSAGSKWGTSTYVTQKAVTNVPICRTCLNSLVSGIRIPFKRRFAITGLIWLGILLLAYMLKASLGYSAIVLGFGTVPIYFLYYLIRPQGLIDWPVKLESQNNFSFENETYARMFASANGPDAVFS